MITMQSQHISCLTTIIFFFKVSQQRRVLREDVKKGKCSSLADFYRSGPSQEKTKRVWIKI